LPQPRSSKATAAVTRAEGDAFLSRMIVVKVSI
jgi:hypothetical protein